jgi:hypothetical protein
MRNFLTACGLSPKLMFSKKAQRGLSGMMPRITKHSLKPLMVGKGVGERRLSDAEIAYNVAHGDDMMSGEGAKAKRRHAPLKFKM